MSSRWSEDKSLIFVKHYENYKCLWDTGIKEYKNRDLRNQAIKGLITDMADSGIMMSEEDIKTRIKAIRTTYCAERRKVQKSSKSGAGADDVYQPSCSWYADADRFLRKSATIRQVYQNIVSFLHINAFSGLAGSGVIQRMQNGHWLRKVLANNNGSAHRI